MSTVLRDAAIKAGDKLGRKSFTKVEIDKGLFVMPCPLCASVEASASERSVLPKFITCSHHTCYY